MPQLRMRSATSTPASPKAAPDAPTVMVLGRKTHEARFPANPDRMYIGPMRQNPICRSSVHPTRSCTVCTFIIVVPTGVCGARHARHAR